MPMKIKALEMLVALFAAVSAPRLAPAPDPSARG